MHQAERAAKRLVKETGSAAELRAAVKRLSRPLLAKLRERLGEDADLDEKAVAAVLREAATQAVAAARSHDDPKVAARRVGNVVHTAIQTAVAGQFEAQGHARYVWVTRLDARVRPAHARLHGTVQRFDKPPIIDLDTGRRGNPGDDWNCRCLAAPLRD